MPDLATHTKIIATAAPAAAAATGQAFGFDWWPLIFSATGGSLALIWLDPPLPTWWRAVLSISASTALGGIIGQILAFPAVLSMVHFFDWLQPWESQALPAVSAALALAIGLLAQAVLPNLLKRAGERAANV